MQRMSLREFRWSPSSTPLLPLSSRRSSRVARRMESSAARPLPQRALATCPPGSSAGRRRRRPRDRRRQLSHRGGFTRNSSVGPLVAITGDEQKIIGFTLHRGAPRDYHSGAGERLPRSEGGIDLFHWQWQKASRTSSSERGADPLVTVLAVAQYRAQGWLAKKYNYWMEGRRRLRICPVTPLALRRNRFCVVPVFDDLPVLQSGL